MIAGTDIHVRVGGLIEVQDLLVAALVEHACTDNLPVSAAVGVLTAVSNRVRRLTDEELVVMEVLTTLASGAPYRVWVDQKELLQGPSQGSHCWPSDRNQMSSSASLHEVTAAARRERRGMEGSLVNAGQGVLPPAPSEVAGIA